MIWKNEQITYKELERLRKSIGLTRKAMAKRLGISVNTYYIYQTGRTPSKRVAMLAGRISPDMKGFDNL